MAFDAGMLRAVLSEINKASLGAKLEKISQPTSDSLLMLLKQNGRVRRLYLSVGANPRMAFTEHTHENPPVPPSFCMLLRKHLLGARLLSAEQPGYERVSFLTFSAFDEMGYPEEKTLVAEIMGKYSNLILINARGKILAVLRYVDMTTSRRRQVLPAMTYELPPKQDKKLPLEETRDGFFTSLAAYPTDGKVKRFLTDTYLGTATQVAEEIVFRALGDTEGMVSEVSGERLYEAFSEITETLKQESYTPTVVYQRDGRPIDFSYFVPRRFGSEAEIRSYPCFSSMLDDFFSERDRIEKTKNHASDLIRVLSSAEGRILRKLEKQKEELCEAEKGECYRLYGDLITANIYRLSRGMTSFTAEDYTKEPAERVTVPLDGRKSPAQNAQSMYKLYTKAKKTKESLLPRIEEEKRELLYLSEVRHFLSRAETVKELLEIRTELTEAGYLMKKKGAAPPKKEKCQPLVAYTSGGYKLLCGRNNLQNEYIDFHLAEKHDIWFHVKGAPGSHVILVTNGEEPPARDYTEAAEFAAFHSGAKAAVEVDYTEVKNLKKPPSAKPGYVIYHKNYTAHVVPHDRKENPE